MVIPTIDMFKEKMEELLSSDIPLFSYKFWDTKKEEMYKVKRIMFADDGEISGMSITDGKSDFLKLPPEGVLIPSTGLRDKTGDDIFAGDIVSCGFLSSVYKDRVVIWDNGWRVLGSTVEEFKMYCTEFVTQVSNIWEDEHLYKIYIEKIQDVLK